MKLAAQTVLQDGTYIAKSTGIASARLSDEGDNATGSNTKRDVKAGRHLDDEVCHRELVVLYCLKPSTKELSSADDCIANIFLGCVEKDRIAPIPEDYNFTRFRLISLLLPNNESRDLKLLFHKKTSKILSKCIINNITNLT